MIDDYGGALVGTNTIDLYKTSRADMKRWGVRHVDIDILQWGSSEQSLKVLRRPRQKHCHRSPDDRAAWKRNRPRSARGSATTLGIRLIATRALGATPSAR